VIREPFLEKLKLSTRAKLRPIARNLQRLEGALRPHW
jgi:hypothetical protein